MFGKKPRPGEDKKNNQLLTAFDRMVYFIFQKQENESDAEYKAKNKKEMLNLCDTILSGKPVLANFDNMGSSDCNFMLSFISGVLYACDGETIQISKKLFLFARKEEYEDGSLRQYVEDIK